MNGMRKLVLWMVLGMVVLGSSGCLGLSLFDSEHTHVYNDKEMRMRLDSLERRVTDLEEFEAEAHASAVLP